MDDILDRLLAHLREAEAELDRELARHREQLGLTLDRHKLRFEKAVLEQQRRFRRGLKEFFARAPVLFVLTAPVIYAMLIPIALLDLTLFVYQAVCFPVYGIRKVRRRDFIAWDRRHLGYLNFVEKLNCDYCGYATGVIAYAREVGSRTEAYWCPIKHALPIKPPHHRYYEFLDYGDAEGFRRRQDARDKVQPDREWSKSSKD
ncbi:MAG: hypothetical protein FJX42_01850 [Alphaproteobacteria bacterium]|nr:hypothetical protein [Alphaproteobacteria bacterium]